jgi:hypothetical protein
MMRLLLVAVIVSAGACNSGSESGTSPSQPLVGTPAHRYTTSFPLTENPISENGVWINGGSMGSDWTNVRTTPGLAFGTQRGSGEFNDSIAILSGAWGRNQSVTATVHTVNQQGGKVIEEVEILLRYAITPHSARGYEVNFRALNSNESYSEVVRWNGPLGDFTYLAKTHGEKFGISDGATVKASIIGNRITVYINDVQVTQVVDSTYRDGSPGMGFFVANRTGANQDYGFTSYTAIDGL